MNEKAAGLGCGDTYFITPNGLDGVKTDEQGKEHIHSTTASDLARIMRYCVTESPAKDEFLKITQTQNHYFTDMAGKRSFNCYNHNAFLTMMEGVLSGKTGFTGGAGYSYVGAMENQGRTYVIALLGCGWPPHKTYKWSDARKLYTDVYKRQPYDKAKELFENVYAGMPVICYDLPGTESKKSSQSSGRAPQETTAPAQPAPVPTQAPPAVPPSVLPENVPSETPVSYTHLDVYKRQIAVRCLENESDVWEMNHTHEK